MNAEKSHLVFTKEFTKQESIPEEGIERALELMRNGRLHRYNTLPDEASEVALLESEFAAYMGTRYCAAFSSCGSSIYIALKSAGVLPGDNVLCNAFTLAPVPGAIENTGAQAVLVEVTPDYTVDLDDLEQKARLSGAKFFLISHMRGHVADMEKVFQICSDNDICLIEDCAHTAGCRWNGKRIGTFGKVGCFSTQTYKHMNSGEGGLLVTDDEDIAAKAILYSGSYMLYAHHGARPSLEVFEKHKKHTPNYSLRMSNLQAALLRPQLRMLDEQCRRWNQRHDLMAEELRKIPHIRVPRRDPKEFYVGSSLQFSLEGMDKQKAREFLEICRQRGVEIKWFGWKEPQGFTSSYNSWRYMKDIPELHGTDQVLDFLCDFRVSLTFSLDDCRIITAIIAKTIAELFPDV